MIIRIWHGWTTVENADAYERLLKTDVLPGIAAMNITGYHNITVLRRPNDDEVEFITLMRFDSLDSVRQFVGEDYERAHVPPRARKILKRFDERSQHYEVIGEYAY